MNLLGINIDHVATIRQARKTYEPDPVAAAAIAELAGADSITVHLREDRRHINDRDVRLLRETIHTKMNLEMSLAPEIVEIAADLRPDQATLVPEKRQEVTTEGGLDIVGQKSLCQKAILKLKKAGIEVSLFIDPDPAQIRASKAVGAPFIELHTGAYANAKGAAQKKELQRLLDGAKLAKKLGLGVNAGHGLNYINVVPLAQANLYHEFNIGHALISRAVFSGLEVAVRDMKSILTSWIL